MFSVGLATPIYVAAGSTDMCKRFERLYGLVRDRLDCHPLSGHVFLLGSANQASKARRHAGRQHLPAHLPRGEQVIGCTLEQCVCQQCGKEKAMIGYEQSEQLNVEPARYFVVVTKREERACLGCSQAVSTAVFPERIVDKGLVSDRVAYAGRQVQRLSSSLPGERNAGTGDGDPDQPGHHGRLADAMRRVTDARSPIANGLREVSAV